MNESKVIQCAKIASELKVTSAQIRLSSLRQDSVPFDNPLSGFSLSGIDWKKEPSERLKQIFEIPIALILICFLILMAPVVYFMALWEAHQEKGRLKEEIANEMIKSKIQDKPNIKLNSLSDLWQLYGLKERQHSDDECLKLLIKWIEILYGKNTAKHIDLNQKIDTIVTRQIKANLPYYERQSEATHFHFASPVKSLIRELSVELQEYAETP